MNEERISAHALLSLADNQQQEQHEQHSPGSSSLAIEPIIYDIPLSSVLEAFHSCLKNKRRSPSYWEFSVSMETQLTYLWERMRRGTYKPSPSSCFIVQKPVVREIFEAAFIDRVAHHWIGLRLEPLLEELFHEQGDVSKNCRPGEGNLKMVEEISELMREVSNDYTEDCYVFKGDIANFFMSLDRSLLWEMISDFIYEHYHGDDIELLLFMLSQTIFNRPQENCIRKSPPSAWDDLPKRKSLFGSDPDRGMAIGNLPSQLLANFAASVLDEWLAHRGVRTYRRFCDDFCIVMKGLEDLKALIPEMETFMREQMHMELHPKKRYLQHYSKGVKIVGAMAKPLTVYIDKRTLGNFYTKIRWYNKKADEGRQADYVEKFVASINSYLGMMIHWNSYNMRKRICNDMILPKWHGYLYFTGGFRSAKVVRKYRKNVILRQLFRQKRLFLD